MSLPRPRVILYILLLFILEPTFSSDTGNGTPSSNRPSGVLSNLHRRQIEEEEEIYEEEHEKERHFIIEDRDGKKLNITFPVVHVTSTRGPGGTFVCYLDRSEDFEGIETFQILVQHYGSRYAMQKDEANGPLKYKDAVRTYEEAKTEWTRGSRAVPYIAAQFDSFPDQFTLGDGKQYGGFENGELVQGREYSIRVRGIVRDGNGEKIIIDTDVIGMVHGPLGKLGIGASVVFSVIIVGFIVAYVMRKKREKKRVANNIAKFNAMLGGDDYGSAEVPEREPERKDTVWYDDDEYDANYAAPAPPAAGGPPPPPAGGPPPPPPPPPMPNSAAAYTNEATALLGELNNY